MSSTPSSQPTSRFPPDLRLGDFRSVLRDIPDSSVDLILTDPPYDSDSVPLYGDLAELGSRVLRPGGFLLAYAGKHALNSIMALMDKHLEYRWMLSIVLHGSYVRLFPVGILGGWRPVLVYQRPPFTTPSRMRCDVLDSRHKEKALHDWQQSSENIGEMVEWLTSPGDLVVDPFLGAGTVANVAYHLGRRFIGCDINPDTLDIARDRVLGTELMSEVW